jgi:uroporphyrinogen-III synthase
MPRRSARKPAASSKAARRPTFSRTDDVVRLLVTRPEGEASAAALRMRGHEVLLAPVLRIETLAAEFGAGPWSALLLTSANAARAIAAHARRDALLHLPLFAVGRRTAAAAREVGFTDVTNADGDQRELASLVAARAKLGPLLYLAGEDRAGDLAGDLARHGLVTEIAVVYRAVALSALPPAAHQALGTGGLQGVLHYSRRSAEAFVACARSADLLGAALAVTHYCLSVEVAAPLSAAGATVRIATRPTESALIDLIGSA